METRLLKVVLRSENLKAMESYPLQFIDDVKDNNPVELLSAMTRLAQALVTFDKSNEIFKTLNKEDLFDIAMFLSENLYTIRENERAKV